MITKDEILRVADETGLTPHVVEKDYVLGWLLAAVHAHSPFTDKWVFKGGTCLKKCYFETYRFSEDLDFTLLDESHLNEEFLKQNFSVIAEWLYEAVGIELPVDRFVFDVYKNKRGQNSCEGKVYYNSYFASGKKSLPKVKFDLTADEVLVMPPARQPVFHGYSDVPKEGMFVHCYSFAEVFGEKVRALGERCRPRDLYDVINLFRNDSQPAAAVVRDVLSQKCDYKGIAIPTMEDMHPHLDAMHTNWSPMLAHQLPQLPDLGGFWDALPEFFAWLEGRVEQERPALGPVSGSGDIYRPAYGQLGLRMARGGSMEIIRFAAANHLCVDLDYTDKSGNRKSRLIEPYSLRQAKNGHVLLYAAHADDGAIRAYRINQINDASVTAQVFEPRYQIELSPGGAEHILQARGSAGSLGLPNRSSGSRRVRSATRRRSSSFGSGPTYVYRCSMCDKTFRGKKQTSTLNAHKDRNGYPCMGRMAIYEDTIY